MVRIMFVLQLDILKDNHDEDDYETGQCYPRFQKPSSQS
jgi:hypothetical protein